MMDADFSTWICVLSLAGMSGLMVAWVRRTLMGERARQVRLVADALASLPMAGVTASGVQVFQSRRGDFIVFCTDHESNILPATEERFPDGRAAAERFIERVGDKA